VYLTPNVIRVTFSGPELKGLKRQNEGGNCKLALPVGCDSVQEFSDRLDQAGAFPVRTYTVRAIREDLMEIDIDFVAHGESGPASKWAMSAKPGSFIGFMGPSPAKMTSFKADWYVLAADLSALPVVAVTLEALPRDARGIALLEITSEADKQEIDAPKGVQIYWLIHNSPHTSSTAQESLLRSTDWPKGRIQTCIAGESDVIKSLRNFLLKEKNVSKSDAYISGYWKIGLRETEHQKMKKAGQI
jgi:NADPH-dependent ferric siderophore reductase